MVGCCCAAQAGVGLLHAAGREFSRELGVGRVNIGFVGKALPTFLLPSVQTLCVTSGWGMQIPYADGRRGAGVKGGLLVTKSTRRHMFDTFTQDPVFALPPLILARVLSLDNDNRPLAGYDGAQ